MKKVEIYTDGASRGNPGPGGWAAVLIMGLKVKEIGGYEEDTTNNKMELQGAIEALKFCRKNSILDPILYTDSQYVLLGIENWVFGWQNNGWQTKQGEPVKNKDQWQELHELNQSMRVSWKKVKGHAGDLGNERADYIATSFADNHRADLYNGSLDGYGALKSDRSFPCYASYVDGVLKYHQTWSDCQREVQGKKGVLYKKLNSASEDEAWLSEKRINK